MEDGVESIEDLIKNSEDMSPDQETEEQIQQGSDREEEDVEGEGKGEDDRASNFADEANRGGGDGGGGGIINSLISNIFHQSEAGDGERGENGGENAQAKVAEEGGGGGGGDGDGDGGGGGIINSLISNIFHQSEAGDEEKKSNGIVESAKNGEENEQVKGAEEGGGGGGSGSSSVLDNIVSHLPKPLSDGMAPATEEASILIHSIVHD